MSEENADQLHGRMMEAWDIQRAIESGQLKTLADILNFVTARADAIDTAFRTSGVITHRSLTMAQTYSDIDGKKLFVKKLQ